MKLYFFRHGHAEDAAAPEYDDQARKLTSKGIERIEAAANALQRLSVLPARLYSSPRVRARQTADILARRLGTSVAVREEVNFGFNANSISALIADLGNEQDVMFVGHEPDLSMTVSSLIGGGEIMMKKGGLARVDLISRQPVRGALVWVLAPHVLDTLDR